MIPEEANVQVESTVQGESIKMRLDENATAHLISMFTDLYEDPELAIIREYSCNGRDAQIEAGHTGPIEVTTPTSLAPFFTVRDHGTGLSAEDIREVYSAYGASTKRGSNDQVGMFGIGAKCAISYTSQFTVIGVKNDRRTVVQVGRDEDGAGTMVILENEPSAEPTGVTITVPVKRHNAFAAKCANFFRFWPEGSVLVDGKAPERIDGLWLADDLLIGRGLDSDYAVMGGVPYPVRFGAGQQSGASVVAFVPVGSATPPPARESLRETKSKEAMIERVRDRVRELSVAAVRKAVDAAPSKPDALRVLEQQRPSIGMMGNGVQWKYRGEGFPKAYEQPKNPDTGHARSMSLAPAEIRGYGAVSEHIRYERVDPSYWIDAVWVEGFSAKFSANHKRKLVQWRAENLDGREVKRFILCAKAPQSEWIEDGLVIPWEDARKIKLPRTTSVNGRTVDLGRIPGSYDVYVGGEKRIGVPADDIDQSEPVYLYRGRLDEAARLAQVIGQIEPEATIVPLPEPRRAKFLRYFPEAKDPSETVLGWINAWRKGLTQDDQDWIAMRRPSRYSGFNDRRPSLARFDAERIADPAVKRAVRLAHEQRPELAAKVKLYQTFGAAIEGMHWSDPTSRYPLLGGSYGRPDDYLEHCYLYLNAVYAAEQVKAAATADPAS